ncbi:hypothetical protein [Sphingopyxis sp. Root214]|uniref:hypothetical protein n=1 Tax=Sphingopyxis sp. Root214 TaxID=1736491 RepID=UPI0019108201|nr:hypothetical protein [Sphingopyxis sp. Root214]
MDRYEEDFKRLKDLGFQLELRMQFDLFPEEMREQLNKQFKNEDGLDKFVKDLPSFHRDYQKWYSESLAIVRQLIPDRVNDFTALYEVPKGRKDIKFGNYVIHDYLQGLRVSDSWGEVKVDTTAALPQFRIQRNIFESSEQRFKSSLFEILSLVQADLLDDEIDAARVLLKNKFTRAAGAVAGVVLESHLKAVCGNHAIKIVKQNPTISVLNDLLKDNNIIDVSQWRFIQHLGDIRNLCDHKKAADPTSDQVQDLIDGVAKISKTVS